VRIHHALISFAIACGPQPRTGDDTTPTTDCDADGAHRCHGSTYETCTGGSWVPVQDCPDGCAEGVGCVDACTAAAAAKSYLGCEYWAVDLDNAMEILGVANAQLGCAQYGIGVPSMQKVCALGLGVAGLCDPPDDSCPMGYTCQPKSVCVLDAQHSPFAIVVSNPQTAPVDVTITSPDGTTFTQAVLAGQVEAMIPTQHGMTDQSIDGTGRSRRAFRVTSTLPIVAYQFNPLDNVNVFSNDASLLVPRSAFDVDYIGIAWPTLGRRAGPGISAHDYRGYLSIVAWHDGTPIEVTPTAATVASANQPALAAGVPVTFMLDAFDVLSLEAAGPDGDLTGTRIRAVDDVSTFGVFVGHEASAFGEAAPPDNAHTRGPCCADHLEEMAYPTSTWGKSFAIARSQIRTNEADVIRVVARKSGTGVVFDPPPASVMSGDCASLGEGEHCTVRILRDTSIEATEPVLVGHYLQSAIWNGGGGATPVTTVGNGDPSMSIAVPIEQHRTDYTILVPSSYEENFLSIAAGPSGMVTVDGATLALESAGTFRAARVPVAAGQHTIRCPERCSVLVYGYSDAVSYMFAGGLDLRPIVFGQ
jgi:hypothetical protein